MNFNTFEVPKESDDECCCPTQKRKFSSSCFSAEVGSKSLVNICKNSFGLNCRRFRPYLDEQGKRFSDYLTL